MGKAAEEPVQPGESRNNRADDSHNSGYYRSGCGPSRGDGGPPSEFPLHEELRNKMTRIATVSGTTARPIWGAEILNPSIALKTEIAGVIVPLPYSKVAPMRPIMTMAARHLLRFAAAGAPERATRECRRRRG
jgi:hypothetical protein